MNIRPKTVRRLVILLAACVLIVAAGASVLYYSHRSKARQELADRAEGLDAFKSENYPVALDKLRGYVGKHSDDFDAMYALAVSRSRVETSNGRHLAEAKALFEQLHAERPDNMDVSHHLLQLYVQIDYLTEAQRVAKDVLDRDPNDVEALRVKAQALARSNKYADALTISQKLNEVAPLDLDGQIQTLELMQTLKRPSSEIMTRSKGLLDAHPNDPRFEMLMGRAALITQDQPTGLKWLRQAAQRTPPDAAFVQKLSRCFDEQKLFDESRELLERASADGNHPDIEKILIERLWENGQFKEVADRLKDLDANAEKSDADLLAFKVLALNRLDTKGEADGIVAALQSRTTSSKAMAWATALSARFDTNIGGKKAIEQYESALSRDRENAVIRCWMGETYMQLGEVELAIQSWLQAYRQMPSWSHPAALLAGAELRRGQTDLAIQFALDSARRAPNLIEPAIVLAQASYQHFQENPNPADAERLIEFIKDDVQRGAPGEPQTLPLLADLQAKAGHRDEAIATIRDAASGEHASPDLLIALADVSRRNQLGIENDILAKLPADRANSPRMALQRALDLSHDGKKDDAFKLLTGPSATSVEWRLAQAEYLEQTKDPRAKDAWIALGDANDQDVRIQNIILSEARSATSDRDFLARTIERLHKLTGDEALGWQFARAKFLLTSEDKRRDSAEAVEILRRLVGQSPDTVEYRVMLAAGLAGQGNVTDAIGHLKAAVERDSASTQTLVDLVKLLLAQNRVDEARSYLDRASRNANMRLDDRKPLAILLAQQGQIEQALALLQPVADSLDADGQLVYAELLRRQGQSSQAEAIYNKLLAEPSPSATAISSAADFFASTDRLDEAKKILAKLDDARFSAKERADILARFNESYVGKDAALPQYLAATNQAPNDADAWKSLIEFYIRNNQFSEATAACDQATAKLGSNEQIANLKAQASALAATKADPSDLRPLIEALSKDPKNAAQVEMLRTIQEARDTKQTPQQIVAKLKTVADRYPNYWPLQQQLVRAYLDLNQPNDAAAVVERLVDARPNDADAAKLAVSVYRAAHRYRDVVRAAQKWRSRALENPTDADVALAEADLALNDTKSAAAQLAPYVQHVKDQPKATPALTGIVAKLWIATGKSDDARALLQPMLTEGPNWRRMFLSLAASDVTPASVATDWIREAAASVPKDVHEEQFVVANAWQQMGVRLSDKDALELARDLLKGLVDQKDVGPDPLVMLASLDADAGDFVSAEDLYRRALKLDEHIPDALNNLAYLLLQRNGDLNEAKTFATRAIALSPGVAAYHDTLARINERLDNTEQAQTEFNEALRLDPANVDARIGLSRTLSAAGKRDKAQQELQRIDTQLNGNPPASESTRRELQNLRESLSSSNSSAAE